MAARVLSRIKKLSLVRATSTLHDVWPEELVPRHRSPAELLRPDWPAPLYRLPIRDWSSSSVDTSPTTAGLVPERTHDRRFGTLTSPLHPAGLRGEASLAEANGHGVLKAPDLLRSSSPAELLRPERPAPLRRLPISDYPSWSVNTSPTAAGFVPWRMHQRRFGTSSSFPLLPAGLCGETSLAEVQGHGVPKVPNLPPRLPVLWQTSCFTRGDFNLTEWVTPGSFMDRYPAVMAVNMARKDSRLHVQNCLIHRNDPAALVLSPSAKAMWQSLVDLVVLNRERGYCIAKSIREENLVVSTVTGRFALRENLVTELPENNSEFVGFEAVRVLFIDLLVMQYGEGVFDLLTDDVSHFLDTLGDRSKDKEGNLSGRHPSLMPYEKCAELMIRIHQLMTMELRYCYRRGHKEAAHSVLAGLSSLYPNLNDMHPFFDCWWKHTEKYSRAMNEHNVPGTSDPDVELGRWLVTMHRHAVIHTHNRDLCQLARTRKYTRKDIVGLLQYKCSSYLPEAVRLCEQHQVWKFLNLNMDRNP